MSLPMRATFIGGESGTFLVRELRVITGDALARPARIAVREGTTQAARDRDLWALSGVTSHPRYLEKAEREALENVQPALGREAAIYAALIPIRKSAAWWALAQDERRAILEARSRHISATQRFLPAIARRLYHARELGGPFDFLTWFEFAPEHEALFDELLAMLRASEEWGYVEREVDLRLTRAP